MTTPPLAISIPEAAKRIGISRSEAWRLHRDGELPTFKVGRRVLISVKALEAWIDHQSKGAA